MVWFDLVLILAGAGIGVMVAILFVWAIGADLRGNLSDQEEEKMSRTKGAWPYNHVSRDKKRDKKQS